MWVIFLLGVAPTSHTYWQLRTHGLSLNYGIAPIDGGLHNTWVHIHVTDLLVDDLQASIKLTFDVDSISVVGVGLCSLSVIGGQSRRSNFVLLDRTPCMWRQGDEVLVNFETLGENPPTALTVGAMGLSGPIRLGLKVDWYKKWQNLLGIGIFLILIFVVFYFDRRDIQHQNLRSSDSDLEVTTDPGASQK